MAPTFGIVFLLIAFLGSCYAEDEQVRIPLDMKRRLQDPTNAFYNWDTSSTSPCHWNGITCNNARLVTAINLDNTGLIGPIPSSLCGLSALKAIQLGENSLYGSIADVFWKNCSQLEILNLTTSSLVGSLLDFFVLGSLQVLELANNNFSGKFPLYVTKLSNLHSLDLNDNPLDPNIIPEEIYSMKELNVLWLSDLSLFGIISPSIGNLTELVDLQLSHNYLNGSIPKEIKRLSKIHELDLWHNCLAGEIPSGLTELVPQKLESLSNFSAMEISENHLTGPLPPDTCKSEKLAFYLALQNSFTGGIPESYGNCSTLVRFRVNNNSLSGMVPLGIWGLPHVHVFALSDNKFEGEISREIKNA
ncbi:hypothetical protein SUGI_0602610 [Cryptomeria japonica]|uniref:receptor-like protein kinase 7 n=1 Tax=Cryptomeria japonica TaxID=3369 RepID=UPI002414CE89|nr:receptor-like protein kinase 7 [Cryptomeria japonica]GLJ30443.1 hypothetical protein SUGI_0602610 [Cryptomeria japonica]